VGQFADALDTAGATDNKTIDDEHGWYRGKALHSIAAALADSGQLLQAMVTAKTIAHSKWRALALASIAAAQYKSGSVGVAQETLGHALADQKAIWPLAIVETQAKAGNIAGALEIAVRMRDHTLERTKVLATIGASQYKMGKTDEAQKTFAQAIDVARAIDRSTFDRAMAIAEIAHSVAAVMSIDIQQVKRDCPCPGAIGPALAEQGGCRQLPPRSN